MLKLYLESSAILAQLRIAGPLTDDLNNISAVHAPTSIFLFINSFDELADKLFERHFSFVSILDGINSTLVNNSIRKILAFSMGNLFC